jgi:Flp pilus assembly protein TadB
METSQDRPLRNRSFCVVVVTKYYFVIYLTLAIVLILLVLTKLLKSLIAFAVFITGFFLVTVIRLLLRDSRRRSRRSEFNDIMISRIIRLRNELI